RVLRLVRLQVPDEMPARAAAHERLLLPRFLHAVLADVGDASGDGLLDVVGGEDLGHGHEGDVFGVSARTRAGFCDAASNLGYVVSDHDEVRRQKAEGRSRRNGNRAITARTSAFCLLPSALSTSSL